LAADRDPPNQIIVVPNFLPVGDRNSLLRFAKKQERKWLTMIDLEKSTATRNVQIRDPGRVTQAVNMDRKESVLQGLFRKALLDQVGPVYGHKPALFEAPYVLRYPPGGKYILHSDGEQFDREAKRWYRLRDRDVSLLIYLNDDYEGGELKFDHLNYTYQPKAGDLVFFPSNHRYSHQSLTIKAGFKWAIVSWACFAHTPRVGASIENWKSLVV
jgi:predicted 2-oxoglutarate/Fe(II)-dependent dioxygenase YbiX